MGGIVSGIGDAIGGALGGPTDYLLGNNVPNELKNPRLTSFSAPGLSANFLSPTNLNVTRSPQVTNAISGVSGAFGNQAASLAALRPLVEPGFGRLTESGVRAIRDARRASMGDLRTNLQRRRVRGSSFGADDINRTTAEFAKQEKAFRDQAFVQELAMKQDLITQQAQAKANQFLQILQQSNIESSIAAQLASGVTSVLSNNAQLIAQMQNRGSNALLAAGGAAGSMALAGMGGPASAGGSTTGVSNPAAFGSPWS